MATNAALSKIWSRARVNAQRLVLPYGTPKTRTAVSRTRSLATSPKTSSPSVSTSWAAPSVLAMRAVVVFTIVGVWVSFTDTATKVMSVAAALGYGVIEFTWYSITTELSNGDLLVTPGARSCREGFTTVAQFLANVFYMPVLVYGLRALVPYALLRVPLWPVNIWVLEVVEGYVLMFLYAGVNPAWDYSLSKDSYFHGLIRLSHWKLWVGLGVVVEVLGAVVL